MGKTYKSFAGHLRSPRGHRQAKLAKVRRRAIPPDPWDDIPLCPSNYIAQKVAFALHLKGWSRVKIIKHIKFKFKMKDYQAYQIVDQHYWWKCKCPECQEAWKVYRSY